MEDDYFSEKTLTDYIVKGMEIMKKFRGEVIEKALQIENVIDYDWQFNFTTFGKYIHE